LADYDGDGRADLLSGSTCCNGTGFYLFRRKADGTFGPRERIGLDFPEPEFSRWADLPINGLKSRPAVADWNGDGHPDLFVAGASVPVVAYGPLGGKDTVTVRRLWPKGAEVVRGLRTNPVLTDWDGDGLIDLVGGTRVSDATRQKHAYDVSWWRNVGTRTDPKLGPPRRLVHVSDSTYVHPTGVAVADWDADGRPDLIVSREEMAQVNPGTYRVGEHKIWVHLRRGK
jgi:hypothetical protein